MANNMAQEVHEAILAGEKALRSLTEAQKYLNSAGNWGVADILGGGFFINLVKHSKIDNAKAAIDEARRDLRNFSRELEDVDRRLPDIEIGGFLTFADFFLDGMIADVFVQSKISDAKRQVDDAIDRVAQILMQLRNIR